MTEKCLDKFELCVTAYFYYMSQARGEDILIMSDGKRRKYLDFIDILLKAQVCFNH